MAVFLPWTGQQRRRLSSEIRATTFRPQNWYGCVIQLRRQEKRSNEVAEFTNLTQEVGEGDIAPAEACCDFLAAASLRSFEPAIWRTACFIAIDLDHRYEVRLLSSFLGLLVRAPVRSFVRLRGKAFYTFSERVDLRLCHYRRPFESRTGSCDTALKVLSFGSFDALISPEKGVLPGNDFWTLVLDAGGAWEVDFSTLAKDVVLSSFAFHICKLRARSVVILRRVDKLQIQSMHVDHD